MMDKNPFKHMRDMLVAKPVPKVDVKHKVMAAIRAKENKEEKVVKKKIGLLVTGRSVFRMGGDGNDPVEK